VKHDAWNHAFNSDPTKDKSLEFVNQLIADNPSSDECEAVKKENIELKLKNEKMIADINVEITHLIAITQ
jgi:hypothetical protein